MNCVLPTSCSHLEDVSYKEREREAEKGTRDNMEALFQAFTSTCKQLENRLENELICTQFNLLNRLIRSFVYYFGFRKSDLRIPFSNGLKTREKPQIKAFLSRFEVFVFPKITSTQCSPSMNCAW